MKRHKYFISFNLIVNGDPMPGNMFVESEREIKQQEDVEEIEETLADTFREKHGDSIHGAILMNFIKL